MAKNFVGIDIGYNRMKLALVQGNTIKKTAIVEMPDRMVQQGRIISVESMGELIRDSMKKNGIGCSNAALVFSDEAVFVKNVTMPIMTAKQLEINIPYEFRDYLTEELSHYLYDYAMITDADQLLKKANTPQAEDQEENDANTMELIAAAIPKTLMEDMRVMFRKAGLKLKIAAPGITAYANLLRRRGIQEECCFLDLGYHAIRMYMFKGDRLMATRELETGLSVLDERIADDMNVDIHIAHTYLMNNFEKCQEREVCRSTYTEIAVELMRAVNFYQFSNPDSSLKSLFICGGGAEIDLLIEEIGQNVQLELHRASELVGGVRIRDVDSLIKAIGIAES